MPAEKQYGVLFGVRVPTVLANQVNATNEITGFKISDLLRSALLAYVRQHVDDRPVYLDEVGWIDPVSLDFEDPEHPDTSSARAARYRKTRSGRWGTRDVIELTAEQAREVLAHNDDDLASQTNGSLADDEEE